MSLKSRITQVIPHRESKPAGQDGKTVARTSKPAAPAATLITPEEQTWALALHQRLVKVMDLSLITSMEESEARKQIREVSQKLIAEEPMPLNEASRQRVLKLIEDEILGLGPLEPLLHDPTISDIMVNGCDTVYVERGGKLEHSPIRFHDDAHLMNIIDRIVTRVGRRIDESSPMVDARLADGSRVNAIVPPLALDGPSLSIRRFAVERLKLDELIGLETLNETMGKVIEGIVGARLNILISGGTGSGKTTILNVASGFIPAD